jgi:uncharacterized protein YbaR (Trm112 family)
MWELEMDNPLEDIFEEPQELQDLEVSRFFTRAQVVPTTNEIICTSCGRITQWYELWDAGEYLEVSIYCPTCRLNYWIEDNYGFSLYPDSGQDFDPDLDFDQED